MGIVQEGRKAVGHIHKVVSEAFAEFGSLAARKPLPLIVVGLVIIVGFMFGLFRFEEDNRVESALVPIGSRVEEERDFFNDKFGGLTRKETISITAKDGTTPVSSAAALNALAAGMNPLLVEDETSLPNPQQIKLNYTIRGVTRTLTQKDFCESPRVPVLFQPSVPGVPYFVQGNFLAVGYQFLTTCLPTKTTTSLLNKLPATSLPVGWGIDRFPCTKVSPLDCFREGQLDYPYSLRQLEQVATPATFLLPLALVDIVYGHPGKDACLTDFGKKVAADLSAVPGVAAAQVLATATKVTFLLNITTSLFPTWGYRWRKSYINMTDAAILAHITAGYRNGIKQVPIQDCVLGKLACCRSWEATNLPLIPTLGALERDWANLTITNYGGVRMVANNFNWNHPQWATRTAKNFNLALTDQERQDLVLAWESAVGDAWDPLHSSDQGSGFASGERFQSFQTDYLVWSTVEDALKDASQMSPVLPLISFLLLLLFVTIALGNVTEPAHSYITIAYAGLFTIALCIVTGFGFTALVGIKFSSLQLSVLPFIACAFSVYNIYLLGMVFRNYVRHHGRTHSINDLMRLTMALAGPSVTLTAIAVGASFACATVSAIPLVRWFCAQMIFTTAFNYIGLMLIFVPLMGLDARRSKAGKSDLVLRILFLDRCFAKSKDAAGITRQGTPASSATGSRKLGHEAGADELKVNDKGGESGSARGMEKPSGSPKLPPPSQYKATAVVSTFVAKYYVPLMNSAAWKAVVIVLGLAFFVAMTVLGFAKVTSGLKTSSITKKGSSAHDYALLTEGVYQSWDAVLVTRDVDYPTEQQHILDTVAAVQNLSAWVTAMPQTLETAWIADSPLSILFFANMTGAASSPDTPIPPPAFYTVFEQYIQVTGQTVIHNVFCTDKVSQAPADCFHPTNTTIMTAGKITFFFDNLTDTSDYLDFMKDTRGTVDTMNDVTGLGAYLYGYIYLFYDQYRHIHHDLYVTVGLSLVGFFVAMLIFQFSILTTLVSTVFVLMICLEAYGMLWCIGGQLNALSLVNLAVMVGLAAEFVVPLCRLFLVMDGSRPSRVGKALEWTFEPLLLGFITSVLAIVPLAFAEFPAYVTYYFGMFAVMFTIAFVNGFVVLPVVLSWIGPPTLLHMRDDGDGVSASDGKGGGDADTKTPAEVEGEAGLDPQEVPVAV